MKQQLDSLQVYRGLAAILVVLHHTGIIIERDLKQNVFLSFFDFGWVGVDFFFVLSGFIIFYIHHGDIGQPKALKPFALKRFIRIYPIYWVVLFTKILVSVMASGLDSYSWGETFKAILLVPQSREILEADFLGVSWTLSYEIFFYALFGLLISLGSRIAGTFLFIWVLGIMLAMSSIFQIPPDNYPLNFLFDQHNLEFILGCIAASVAIHLKVGVAKGCAAIAFAWVTFSIVNTNEYDVLGLPSVLTYGIPFALIVGSSISLEKQGVLSFLTGFPLLIWLGDASYSIYLTHGFLIARLTRIGQHLIENLNLNWILDNSIAYGLFATCIICIAVSMAGLVYKFLEKPLVSLLRAKLLRKQHSVA